MHGTTATIPPESPPIFTGAHEALTIDVLRMYTSMLTLGAEHLSLVEKLSCLGGSQLNYLQLLSLL